MYKIDEVKHHYGGDNIRIFAKVWDVLLWLIIITEILLIIAFLGIKLFKISPYIVTSSSMVPKYPVGSLIYVKEVKDFNSIEVGDTITFFMKDSKIIATHEVYKIEDNYFYTQGINNLDSKGNVIHDVDPVPFQRVIGKPIFCIPYLGYVNKFITKSPGAYIVIIITLIMIVISYLLDERKESENEKR